jgi:hypothetical protein
VNKGRDFRIRSCTTVAGPVFDALAKMNESAARNDANRSAAPTQVLAIAGDVEAISKRMGAVLQSEWPGREQKLPPRQSH